MCGPSCGCGLAERGLGCGCEVCTLAGCPADHRCEGTCFALFLSTFVTLAVYVCARSESRG